MYSLVQYPVQLLFEQLGSFEAVDRWCEVARAAITERQKQTRNLEVAIAMKKYCGTCHGHPSRSTFKYNAAYNPIGTTFIAFPSLESVDVEILIVALYIKHPTGLILPLSQTFLSPNRNESKQSSLSSFSPHNDPVASIQYVLHTSSVQAESSFVQEANAFRSHQCCPVDHEGRTVAINDIKAAGIAHVLRVDQGSARSAHPGAGPLAFPITPSSSLDYDVDPSALPRSRKVKNKDILDTLIWKAGDHEWRTIQYGVAEVIEGGLEPCWVLASSLREKGYKFLSQKTNPTT
ncbi:uncharacterized protein C8R40DRAFT_1067331 [Lentinula edodes]|uniref:uncharacterized protein n=1 Tax=Lentinula edodes TaxID=5353 RepID=UPI001E8DDAB1|nr:uncharacterized protein C8R40DRAFT_1067331 [Lentinula edodes]KAH7878304.1 hypothetical protein C8R40DRAFT_1067331 [Lentinula edodes]